MENYWSEIYGEVIGFVHQVFFEDSLHAGMNSLITCLFLEGHNRGEGQDPN
jgi:hypothetical protein